MRCGEGKRQGEAFGRVGLLEVTVKIVEGEPMEVKVGGNAVIVFQTLICV